MTNDGTYLSDYNWTSAGPGSYNLTSGNSVTPQARTNTSVKYAIGDWQATLQHRYIPKIDDTSSRGNGRNPLNYDYIDEHSILDARVRWDATETTRLLFGVNNLMDEEPPYVFNTGNNTAPGLYGSAVVGRFLFARVTQSF